MEWSFFDRQPLLPPAVCLAAGIAVGSAAAPAGAVPLAVLAVLVAATLCAGRWPVVQGACLWLSFAALGVAVAPAGGGVRLADGVWAEAVVASAPSERPKTLMTELLLPSTGERRRCYVWKDERSRQLRVGHAVVVRLHDGQFVGAADWRRGGTALQRLSPLQRLRLRALGWRQAAVDRLTAHSQAAAATTAEDDAWAVLAAMTLGERSALTPELRDTYARSGASHVLALSGLHLSIIYMLLTLLTLGRRRFRLGQVAVVAALWAFALLTGLSMSVVRATTMLTLYALFALGGRRQAPLSVLSFTAIVMLLADGAALFDIGFQLSFMAMLAILLFMPRLRALAGAAWTERHPVLRWLGGLMAVSVAAQLGTAPLVAYHFGRFSTWFLLTNLVVVPCATLILYGALLVLLVPAAGTLLMALVKSMNGMLAAITRLPLASVEGLRPSLLQVALLYVAVAVLYALLAFCGRRRQ